MWNILRASSRLPYGTLATFQAGHFRGHQAYIVNEFVPGIFAHFSEQLVKKLIWWQLKALLRCRQQAIIAKFLLCDPVDFKKAVREQEQNIVDLQRTMTDGILRPLEKS